MFGVRSREGNARGNGYSIGCLPAHSAVTSGCWPSNVMQGLTNSTAEQASFGSAPAVGLQLAAASPAAAANVHSPAASHLSCRYSATSTSCQLPTPLQTPVAFV